MSSRAAVRAWLLTRLLALVVFALFESVHRIDVSRDVGYYGDGLAQLASHGLAHVLVEYPAPAVLMMLLPWLLARAVAVPHAFVVLFATAMLAVDAAFTRALVRRRVHVTATAAWLLGVPVLGALSYFRFDLLPAVLVGWALLTLVEHPRRAQVLVAVATAIKLWPALVVAPLVAGARRRWAAIAVTSCVGGAFALLGVVLAGWPRLVSPLTYEAHRGLQTESVWATPALVGWGLDGSRWRVFFSPYKSYEITGWQVRSLVTASTVSSVMLAVVVVALLVRLLRLRGSVTPEQVTWVSLVGVTGFVVTGKVLSPQYLLWLLAIVVAGLALSQGARAFRTWGATLLVAAALTHAYFPEAYVGLVHHHRGGTPYAVGVLAVRNALLVWLFGSALARAWRTTTAPSPAVVT